MASVTLEEAINVKARHEHEWLKREGVTGIDVGRSGENAVIRVYVQDPATPHGFPSRVEGVPVEVVGRTFELH